MNVVWTPEAEQDRVEIWDGIAADNPLAADRMDRLFSDAAAKVAAEVIWVLALVHAARRWPPSQA